MKRMQPQSLLAAGKSIIPLGASLALSVTFLNVFCLVTNPFGFTAVHAKLA
jgi:hypothetical protein